MTDTAYHAIRAAKGVRLWGRWPARRYARKHNAFHLFLLAYLLETNQYPA